MSKSKGQTSKSVIVGDDHKRCRHCHEVKHVEEFSPHAEGVLGRQAKCRPCAANYEFERRSRKTEDELRDERLRRTHGISLRDYNEMSAKQDGVCAICKKPQTSFNHWSRKSDVKRNPVKNLSVDHCHTTGFIRGLLCDNCNKAIGFLMDDPDLMRAAADYVVFHAERAADPAQAATMKKSKYESPSKRAKSA